MKRFGRVHHDEGPDDDSDPGNLFSISADGLALAFGSKKFSFIQIFRYIANGWTQQGSNITSGDKYNGKFNSVSLSFDGSKVTIDALLDDASRDEEKAGKVYIYSYNEKTQSWISHSTAMNIPGAQNGGFVSLSADGSVVGTSILNETNT